MKLINLSITLNQWGDDKGKYTGEVTFKDKKETEVKVILTPEMADKYLQVSSGVLIAAADHMTEQFKSNLIISLSYANQQPQLT